MSKEDAIEVKEIAPCAWCRDTKEIEPESLPVYGKKYCKPCLDEIKYRLGRDKPAPKKRVEWMGDTTCNICRAAVPPVLVDGKTKMGPWAVMCGPCHGQVGVGLGTGRGQKYELTDGTYLKVEG